MRTPSPRARRIAIFTVGPIAVIGAGLLIWQISAAAFTAQTQNVGNSWSSGTVSLTDDDNGVAAFQITNVTPGQTGSNCLLVTSHSTLPGVVKTYIARLGASGLQDYIIITMGGGTGGTFNNCTGFVPDGVPVTAPLSAAAAVYANYATGGLPWTTTGTSGETRSYKVSWTFDTSSLTQAQIDALQGKTVSADVVWELQSN